MKWSRLTVRSAGVLALAAGGVMAGGMACSGQARPVHVPAHRTAVTATADVATVSPEISAATHSRPGPSAAAVSRSAPLALRVRRLPLRYRTHDATRVITVTAGHSWSTTATLRAWNKARGGGWVQYGRPVTAHVGADGIGQASETTEHTPQGSFTLTHAFGRKPNPGTGLHYFRTTPADWWISQTKSPLYNTHQRCSSGCPFDTSSSSSNPNEHLYYETPYYNHAVVIDYNTRNAPGGVRPGAGSAFFLHVTDGQPTAGCVAINPRRLNVLMRWLVPSAHPRILIGVK